MGPAYAWGNADFPTTANAYERSWATPHGAGAAFVTVLNATGSALLYSTYLSGNVAEQGLGIAVDPQGHAAVYVVGTTNSTDFPVSAAPLQGTLGGSNDAFVARINTGV